MPSGHDYLSFEKQMQGVKTKITLTTKNLMKGSKDQQEENVVVGIGHFWFKEIKGLDVGWL